MQQILTLSINIKKKAPTGKTTATQFTATAATTIEM